MSLTAYGALAESGAEHKLPGQEGVSDLGAGLRADYPLSDEISFSAGRLAPPDAYGFDVNQRLQAAPHAAGHLSAAVTYEHGLAHGIWQWRRRCRGGLAAAGPERVGSLTGLPEPADSMNVSTFDWLLAGIRACSIDFQWTGHRRLL